MIVTLHKQDLDNEQLSWLCIEETLTALRGKDPSAKLAAYNGLNEGQKSLYMFYAFHNHTKSVAELYWFASYFMTDLKGWPALMRGIAFYCLDDYLAICHEIEQLVEQRNKRSDGTWRQALASDLDHDPALLTQMSAIYERYAPIAKEAINQMNTYIRENSADFLIVSE
ncbi:hypothetical protein FHS15_005185 [Paenibacillus castaneae]|uniref:hypothetical protein n=1 Tax=Paenibacillus castaneae TaxID=474957 RepID=UPI000C9D0F41|nr:hypothetical protein [Paenibacillus castaneae]NIK80001.1 hypothetical protein [Paenibacillus castaneae]